MRAILHTDFRARTEWGLIPGPVVCFKDSNERRLEEPMLKFCICLVIGLLCALIWFSDRTEAAATTKWPTVPGVITEMKITESRMSDGTTTKTAVVKYAYSVAGKSYEGDRTKVEVMTSPSDAARYPKGTPVT